MACGILVPQPGIEPLYPGVEMQSPNHWTTRELPLIYTFELFVIRCIGYAVILSMLII